jgi:hypothetical protein
MKLTERVRFLAGVLRTFILIVMFRTVLEAQKRFQVTLHREKQKLLDAKTRDPVHVPFAKYFKV